MRQISQGIQGYLFGKVFMDIGNHLPHEAVGTAGKLRLLPDQPFLPYNKSVQCKDVSVSSDSIYRCFRQNVRRTAVQGYFDE